MNLLLKELRLQRKWSQPQVSRGTGISVKRLSTYENHTREPDLDTLSTLADFFGVSLDELTGRTAAFFDQQDNVTLELSKFGERIRDFRLQRGMEKEELAAAADISPAYLSIVESGAKTPKLETCLLLLNALHASADAAFMDSLDVGWKERANYIRFELEPLPSNVRKEALDILELLVKSYKQNSQKRVEPPTDEEEE